MIKAIMIGAGQRGMEIYGKYSEAHPDKIIFVGVADPDETRRTMFSNRHNIRSENVYESYSDLLEKPKFADACFVCTQDRMHVEPAIKAMDKNYHVFLEKPMAIEPVDTMLLDMKAKEQQVYLMIGHVLRYTPFFSKIHDIVQTGKIGKMMSIQHNENVSYWHYAHSYVRGSWKNDKIASPMILAKSCHDLDLLCWLADSNVKKVSSFGSLSYFSEKNAARDIPEYCVDGCPRSKTCQFYAPKVYDEAPDWMRFSVASSGKDKDIEEELKKGDYGRCVYRSANNVVDHQVVIMEFVSGATVAFTMSAFTNENTRTIKIMGTEGTIKGHFDKGEITIQPFGKKPETLFVDQSSNGHNGGDEGIMDAFIRLLTKNDNKEVADSTAAVESHLVAFASEESRLKEETIDFITYKNQKRTSAKAQK